MHLNLREIIYVPGASVSFDFNPNLSDAVSGCISGIKQAKAAGRIQNSAGVLVLSADVDALLECSCARCLEDFERPISLKLEATLSDRTEDQENPDIYFFEGDNVDIGKIITSDFILSLDDRILCKDDCKGLCENCGANLNDGPCKCKKEVDPRLAALGQLLEDE